MDIRATIFNQAIDKYYNFFNMGKVYTISWGKLKVADPKWNRCKSQYEMTLDNSSEVALADDEGEVQVQCFDFVKIEYLEQVEPNKNVDVIGIVQEVSDVQSLMSKKTGQEHQKADVTIIDDTGYQVRLTLWGNQAVNASREISLHKVVAFRRVRVSDYGGVTLSGPQGTFVEPKIPETEDLYSWWKSQGSRGTTVRSLSSTGGMGGRLDPLYEQELIDDIERLNLGYENQENGDYQTNTASPLTLISNLNLYQNRWTIEARVVAKSDIRTWSNPKGEGSLFSIDLLDSSGMDIRATMFKEAVDKYYNFFVVGKVYTIGGGKLKVANLKWNTCKSQFEMTLDNNSAVALADDEGEIQAQSFDFVKIGHLEQVEPNKNVDVIGIVQEVSDVQSLMSKKTGQEHQKADVTIIDDTGCQVRLTLWGNQAVYSSREIPVHKVVAFRRARVSNYSGVTFSDPQATFVEPKIPETEDLYSWWKSQGSRGAPQLEVWQMQRNTSGDDKHPWDEEKVEDYPWDEETVRLGIVNGYLDV